MKAALLGIWVFVATACGESAEERWHAYPADPRVFDRSKHATTCDSFWNEGFRAEGPYMPEIYMGHGRPQSREIAGDPANPEDTLIVLHYPGIKYRLRHSQGPHPADPTRVATTIRVQDVEISSAEFLSNEYLTIGTLRDSIGDRIVDHVVMADDSVLLTCGHEDKRPPMVLYLRNDRVERIKVTRDW